MRIRIQSRHKNDFLKLPSFFEMIFFVKLRSSIGTRIFFSTHLNELREVSFVHFYPFIYFEYITAGIFQPRNTDTILYQALLRRSHEVFYESPS